MNVPGNLRAAAAKNARTSFICPKNYKNSNEKASIKAEMCLTSQERVNWAVRSGYLLTS